VVRTLVHGQAQLNAGAPNDHQAGAPDSRWADASAGRRTGASDGHRTGASDRRRDSASDRRWATASDRRRCLRRRSATLGSPARRRPPRPAHQHAPRACLWRCRPPRSSASPVVCVPLWHIHLPRQFISRAWRHGLRRCCLPRRRLPHAPTGRLRRCRPSDPFRPNAAGHPAHGERSVRSGSSPSIPGRGSVVVPPQGETASRRGTRRTMGSA